MVTLYTLTHSDWWMLFCGLCAFAVTMALLRNISQQRPLPPPTSPVTERLWRVRHGIGGFSLGLERTGGFKTIGFVEIDPYCRAVLKKQWPDVQCYGDIREVNAERLALDGIKVDAIAGGFPCQDISVAGGRAGIGGSRSGLWSEYARLIGEIRPRVALIENVSALLIRGMGTVLRDLAALGFDAEWDCIPAASIGALHFRDRVWILAYPDTHPLRPQRFREAATGAWSEQQFAGLVQDQIRLSLPAGRRSGISDGVSGRMGQLKAYGNAIVPQIAEMIGHAILNAESQQTE